MLLGPFLFHRAFLDRFSLALAICHHYIVARMGQREVTVAELVVQAEANHHKKVAHKEQDRVRESEKHAKKTKRDQDTMLKRYVLCEKGPINWLISLLSPFFHDRIHTQERPGGS
jgi:hypothetical protein